MITEQEKLEVIEAAIERMLTILPKAIGSIITHHIYMARMHREFYSKHPDLRNHKDIVAATVEGIEGVNTFSKYEEILEKAVPKIRENIKLKSGLEMKSISKPSTKVDLGDL